MPLCLYPSCISTQTERDHNVNSCGDYAMKGCACFSSSYTASDDGLHSGVLGHRRRRCRDLDRDMQIMSVVPRTGGSSVGVRWSTARMNTHYCWWTDDPAEHQLGQSVSRPLTWPVCVPTINLARLCPIHQLGQSQSRQSRPSTWPVSVLTINLASLSPVSPDHQLGQSQSHQSRP